MEVMTLHEFMDVSVEKVVRHIPETREIVLQITENSVVLHKTDVIALAKDFGLHVYDEKDLL